MEEAWRVFIKMPFRDVVTWNAILGGCAIHGHSKEILHHFEQMCEEGVLPDDITFVYLLSACNHAGLVDEDMHCHASMIMVYTISANLEHYTCMFKLLDHDGHLQEPENMIKAIPHKPDMAVWTTLIGAYRILELEPKNVSGYVLLSNIYAAAGTRHVCENVEQQRKERGVKKGHTWIELNNEGAYEIVVDDQRHALR